MKPVLSEPRKFLSPAPGEDWSAIATRSLPAEPVDHAIQLLKSWNVHLMLRVPQGEFTGSDVLFTEPPREQNASLFADTEKS